MEALTALRAGVSMGRLPEEGYMSTSECPNCGETPENCICNVYPPRYSEDDRPAYAPVEEGSQTEDTD